jgi:hypothetical protein
LNQRVEDDRERGPGAGAVIDAGVRVAMNLGLHGSHTHDAP